MFLFRSWTDFKDFSPESINEIFRKNAELCVDFVCDHARNIESKPVAPDVQPGYLRECLPGERQKMNIDGYFVRAIH